MFFIDRIDRVDRSNRCAERDSHILRALISSNDLSSLHRRQDKKQIILRLYCSLHNILPAGVLRQ